MTNLLEQINAATKAAEEKAAEILPNEAPPFSITPCMEQRVKKLEEKAFELFNKVLQLYKQNELMIAFNGGKDCTVMLHMIIKYFTRNKPLRKRELPVLYVEEDQPFDEITEVVNECTKQYPIKLYKQNVPIKKALNNVLEELPNIKAVFLGSRRTDPYCDLLTEMKPCDPGWPPLMRISPLIDWNYRDIWYYLFVENIFYCRLYEQGYTSLGSKDNTLQNPHLRVIDSIRTCDKPVGVKYKHAAELEDGLLERAGREIIKTEMP